MSVNMGRGNSVTRNQWTNGRPDRGPINQSLARNVGVCVLDIWSGALTAREPKLIISEERVSEEISATGLRSWSQSCTFPWNLSQPIDNYQVLTNQRTEWAPISQSEDPVSIVARRQKSVRGICKLRLASG